MQIMSLAFLSGLISSSILFLLMVTSRVKESFRFWPPGDRNRYWISYWVLATVNMLAVATMVLIKIPETSGINLASVIGLSLILSGIIITLAAIRQLGSEQTSGLENKFVDEGLYAHTRNPQVIGDLISLLGVIIFYPKLEPVIVSLMTALWLIAMIFAEEQWLGQQYCQNYREYREKVPRFL